MKIFKGFVLGFVVTFILCLSGVLLLKGMYPSSLKITANDSIRYSRTTNDVFEDITLLELNAVDKDNNERVVIYKVVSGIVTGPATVSLIDSEGEIYAYEELCQLKFLASNDNYFMLPVNCNASFGILLDIIQFELGKDVESELSVNVTNLFNAYNSNGEQLENCSAIFNIQEKVSE